MRKVFVLLLLLFLITWMRLLTWSAVFPGGDVSPFDADPYYRLRQIQLIAHHFPHCPPVDTYSLGVEHSVDPTFTRKEPGLHPSMFLMAWVFSGFRMDDASLRRGAMFVPIAWAIITVLLAFMFTRWLRDRFAASMAALYAGLCLPILWRTSLGALDNHMTEGALFLTLLLVSAGIQRHALAPEHRYRVMGIYGGVLAGCALISYWTALGAGMLALSYSLSLTLFGRGERAFSEQAREQTGVLGGSMLFAGLFHLALLNFFSAACLLGLGAYLIAQTAVWRIFPRVRVLVWALAIVAGAGILHLVAPPVTEKLWSTIQVALHISHKADFTTLFYSIVAETRPIPASQLHVQYSFLIWIMPICVVLLAWRAYRTRDFTTITLCLMALLLFFPSLSNRRFSHMAAAVLAPIAGYMLSGMVHWVLGRISRPHLRQWSGWIIKGMVTAGMVVGFLPYVQYNTHVRLRTPAIAPGIQETFRWMKQNTPSCDGIWNPNGKPPYRVMAIWDIGWWMIDQAQRVPVANNAGEGAVAELDYFFRARPEDAWRILEREQARYVVASVTEGRAIHAFRMFGLLPKEVLDQPKEPANEAHITQTYLTTVHAGLYVRDGGHVTEGDTAYPALEHYRLLFESIEQSTSPLGTRSAAKFFETVPGARITGSVAPGATVTATLELKSNTGRGFTYREQTVADSAGVFHLCLPYPTDAPSGETRPLGSWQIASGDIARPLDVPTEAVLNGSALAMGTLAQP